jgi:endonuclease/exonuclease/phosphatase family metal-dependent hydrolase
MSGWAKDPMKANALLAGLAVGVPTVAIALFYLWASAGTTDSQNYATIAEYDAPLVKDSAESYTLVSYNIGYLSGLANNTTEKPKREFFEANQARVIAALQAENPDIVAFQEIDLAAQRSYEVNQAQTIAQALKLGTGAIAINWDKRYLPFPYWPPQAHFGKTLSGQAVLSRYAIEAHRRIVLERVADKPFFYKAFYLDRLAQVAQVNIAGKPVVVINIHLEAFDEETRRRQTQFVRSLAEEYAQKHPVILLGDFNSAINRTTKEKDFSINIMAESGSFASAIPQAQWGSKASATFPADQPEYNLDYIWYTPASIEPIKTAVVSAAGQSSDHLPLMMEFRLKD